MTNTAKLRAKEPDLSLWMLPGPVWVRCPRCDAPARIEARLLGQGRRAAPRLSCTHCGFTLSGGSQGRVTRTRRARIDRWAPRCDRCGRPVPRDTVRPSSHHAGTLHLRWRCPGCGHVSLFPAAPVPPAPAEGVDPLFGLPLVLQVPIGRHLLWAWNAHHLLLLERWLGATLRERSVHPTHWSLASRLPGWIKAAAMRPRALAAIADLRALALANGIA